VCQSLWEIDDTELAAMRDQQAAQESIVRKSRLTLDAERLLGPLGIIVLKEDAPHWKLSRDKAHLSADTRVIVNGYRNWAARLHPNMHFRRLVRRSHIKVSQSDCILT